MDSFLAFLEMGGYAAWVWSAYGLAAIGLIGMLVLSKRTLTARTREFEDLKARRGAAS